MRPTILAIGTAVPENQIQQSQIAEFMSAAHGLTKEEKRQLLILYRATGIHSRHSVIEDYKYPHKEFWKFYPEDEGSPPPSTEQRGQFYREHAIKLSSQAIRSAITKSGIEASQITHLITVSCTGMYAPGLDFDIIDQLKLDKTVQRTAINFMGCFAAITAMKNALAVCKSDQKSTVLVICVELCTIHFQNEKTEDNLLANAIFGDGAAAFLMSNRDESLAPTLSPMNFHSDILPDGRNDMAWNIGNFGYEMKLSAYVPDLIKSGVQNLIQKLTLGLTDSPDLFAVHPGGKKILEVIEQELSISKEDNRYAYQILQAYGNMSSPTLLFVLEKLMSELTAQSKGQKVLSLAFGPGLTLESVLLEVS